MLTMDQVQGDHERAVGETFITWYNAKHRTAFKFTARAGEAPDLLFCDGGLKMHAEVTSAYYDALQAGFLWMPARRRADAPRIWEGVDFEKGLIRSINDQLANKCQKDYGRGCVLLISVHPTVTTATMMKEVLEDLVIPERNPFEGVYLVGHFVPAKRIGQAVLEVRQLAYGSPKTNAVRG